jgi:hypothetical protein
MTAELTTYQPQNELQADMEYARVVSSGAMLPTQYRGKPADILIAMGLGRAMGLSPAESLYRIHVIQGRPTASAELIAANVRKAGHILRVKGDETSARAVIIRSDDPEFEFESTWNLDRAKRLGLSDKDGWKKQPGTMMRWRAITEVARLACPEALYGVAYVREELDDLPRETTHRVSAADFAPQPDPVVTEHLAEIVEEERADTKPEQPGDKWPNQLTDATRKRMFAVFNKHGITDRDEQIAGIVRIIGRPIQSRSELTEDEAQSVTRAVEAHFAQQATSE